MSALSSFRHLLGGTFLVAGTTIGVGMLALPVVTSGGGFWPAMLLYVLCWMFTLFVGFLFYEICLQMPPNANILSMSRHFLGKTGASICWFFYFFLFITLTIAHLDAGGQVFNDLLGLAQEHWLGPVLYTLLTAPFIFIGVKAVDPAIILLMIGMGVFYVLFLVVIFPHLDPSLLNHANWALSLFDMPFLILAFAYQIIVPTLVNYLERDRKKVRFCMIVGTIVPFIVYALWEFVILATVPLESLQEAAKAGQDAVAPLRYFLQDPHLFTVGRFFAFFTMTSSFLALALSFMDALSDGLNMPKIGWRKLALCALIFLLPLIVMQFYQKVFIIALSYAGGLCFAILTGVLPIAIIWVSRYKREAAPGYRVWGGKSLLIVMFLFICLELAVEIYSQISLLMPAG